MKKLEIKPAIADYIEEILALDRLCFAGIWSKDGYLREIDSPKSSLLLLWVTENDSKPKIIGIGCLWSILDEAHITLLGIHPQYHRQGLGMLMLYSLLQDGATRGLSRATLEVKENNQVAINLYQKFGFRMAGKRRNYYPQTGEDALVFWLNGLERQDFSQQLNNWWQQISRRIDSQELIFSL